MVVETEFGYKNVAVYLTKDVDTTDGPVMLYLYYRESFHVVEMSDVQIA